MEIKRPVSKQPIPEDARLVHKGRIFEVYEWDQELYNGEKITFEKIKRPDTVSIFPVLPDGKILMTEQEQPGRAIMLGSFGGRVDEGEDILAAAKRELLEESGYEAEEWILWDAEQPITKIEWAIYTFVAKGLKKVTEPSLDGGEKIEYIPVTLDELLDMATSDTKKFGDKEISTKFYQAKLDPKKMEELRELFRPL